MMACIIYCSQIKIINFKCLKASEGVKLMMVYIISVKLR